jgi:hypothetical protein
MNVSLFWPLDAKVSLARSSARANVAQLLRKVNIANDGSAPAHEADRTASVQDAKQIKEVLDELVGPLQVEHVHTHLCHGPTQQPVATRDGAVVKRRVDVDEVIICYLTQSCSLVASITGEHMEAIAAAAARLWRDVEERLLCLCGGGV